MQCAILYTGGRLPYSELEVVGGELPHRMLWVATPGISQTGVHGMVQLHYLDWEILMIKVLNIINF